MDKHKAGKNSNEDIVNTAIYLLKQDPKEPVGNYRWVELQDNFSENWEECRAFLRGMADGVYILDSEGTFVFVNDVVFSRSGFRREDVIGRNHLQLLPDGKDREVAQRNHRAIMEGEPRLRYELGFVDNTGKQQFAEVNTTPIWREDTIIGLLGVSRIITDQKEAAFALRASEEKYRSLAEHSALGIAISQGGEYVYVNEPFARMFGYSVDDLLSFSMQELTDLIHPEHKEEVLKRVEDRLAGKECQTGLSFRMVHRDGSVKWVESFSSKIEYDHAPALQVLVLDITEKYLAEEAIKASEEKYRKQSQKLKRSREELEQRVEERTSKIRKLYEELQVTESKFRSVLEHSRDIIYQLNLTTTSYDYLSPSIELLTGYSVEEMLSQGFAKLEKRFHPDDRERFTEHFQNLLSGGVKDDIQPAIEYRWLHRDGGYRWFSDNRTLLREEDGSPVTIVGTVRDITEAKEAHSKIKESEERHRAITENLSVGVYRISLQEFNYLEVNSAFLHMFGFERREQIVGVNAQKLLRSKEQMGHLLEKIREQGQLKNYACELLRQDGSVFWGNITGVAIRDLDQKLVYFDGIVEDITQRRKKEEEMRRQLMSFDLQEGHIYLETDTSSQRAFRAFRELQKVGYQAVVLSRSPEQEYGELAGRKAVSYWLSRTGVEGSLPPEPARLITVLGAFEGTRAIFLERLDYLISQAGFRETLSFVQELRDLAHLNGHVVILSLDQATLLSTEQAQLARECLSIQVKDQQTLPETGLDILRVVKRLREQGAKVSYTTVGKELEMSRPTLRKRIQALVKGGYLLEKKKGRSKLLELTVKGSTRIP